MAGITMNFPPPVPDKATRFDQRARGWLTFVVGLAGAAHQIFLSPLPNPALLTFCAFLLGAPAAEKLWASRKAPDA